MKKPKAGTRGQVRLTLNVTYALDGETVEVMRDLLHSGVQGAIGDGLLLRGSTRTEVESFSLDVSVADGPAQVFVATYEHRHGEDQRVFATEAKAYAWRNALAAEYWAEELSDEPMPEDPSEVGTEYFDEMSDRDRPEFFRVEALEVESD